MDSQKHADNPEGYHREAGPHLHLSQICRYKCLWMKVVIVRAIPFSGLPSSYTIEIHSNQQSLIYNCTTIIDCIQGGMYYVMYTSFTYSKCTQNALFFLSFLGVDMAFNAQQTYYNLNQNFDVNCSINLGQLLTLISVSSSQFKDVPHLLRSLNKFVASYSYILLAVNLCIKCRMYLFCFFCIGQVLIVQQKLFLLQLI